MELDLEACRRAVQSKDARFDGVFFSAVVTTGIYCRPSCPATPKLENVRFYPSAAAAQGAGFRACKRCRPDATPGSPEWNGRGDVVARAMRLIADGVVDRHGVDEVARRVGYSPRHLHRQLVAEVGAGPLALARAQRGQTARILLETTDLTVTAVAFASGFGSVRQFNDTVQEIFATSPSGLRRAGRRSGLPTPGALTLRLPFRRPFHGAALLDFLAARAVAGVEEGDTRSYRRSLVLPHGEGVIQVEPADDHVRCVLWLGDGRDLSAAVHRTRRLLDLDADPQAVDAALGADPLLAPLVTRRPGLRLPGHVDGSELALRAVLGQQVSVAGARTVTAQLVARYGKPLTAPVGGLTHTFPSADTLAAVDPAELPLPAGRARTLVGLAQALADGDIVLDDGADRAAVAARLVGRPGIGAWTAQYVALRALGDPDVLVSSDLGVRRSLAALGGPDDPRAVAAFGARWSPWRSYATVHLWSHLHPESDRPDRSVRPTRRPRS
jgi:AraC family transcriptional regulator, regulatory protein of adaptative response / DNA-3-methyladenine glycosylase II